MAKAKTNPKRKDKLETFKQSQKSKNMSEQAQTPAPEVRQVPVWKANETLEINGLEFQSIYESFSALQEAFAAMQSVVNKNIMNGKIKLDFEKFDKSTGTFVQMTDEEKAPHAKQVEEILATLRQAQAEKEQAKVVSIAP